jgi:hypothetical protein
MRNESCRVLSEGNKKIGLINRHQFQFELLATAFLENNHSKIISICADMIKTANEILELD